MRIAGKFVAVACSAMVSLVAQDPLEGLPGFEDLGDPAVAGAKAGGIRVTGVSGFLESRGRVFVRDRRSGDGRRDAQWVQELELELDFAFTGTLSGYMRPRFLIDALDDELVRTDPLEAYVSWTGEDSDVRVGQFVENWGIADTFNPVDVLNRRDLAEDPLDPPRLGELGVRARWHLPGGDTIGEPIVSAYAIPVFQDAEFPTSHNRFSLATPPNRLREDQANTPDGSDRWFFALRTQSTLTTALANADLQFVASRGPERFPDFSIAGNAGGGVDLMPIYYGANTLGGGFRAVPNGEGWDEYTLKAEVVFKVPYRFDGQPTNLPDEYVQYAFGFDRLFPNVLSDKDQLTLTVEWVGETGASDPTSTYRAFDDDLVVRGFWEANDFARTSLEVRGIVDGSRSEWVAEAIFQRQLRMIHEDLQFEAGARWFQIDRSEPGFFSLFPDNSNVWVSLRLDF